ncbi:MAG TPA: isoprenylcysteine carboxylmethyltransferase family protein [Longimicrobiaceae bacterium]|nr:isoprenylcysteine carboxylmethyltransferase family protein [Longimicrobiaceae bacterium]
MVQTKTNGAVKPLLGFPPPLVALLLIGVGLGIHRAFPARLLPEGWIQFLVALPLLGLGAGLAMRSVKAFQRVGTDERYAGPTSVIVQDGLYGRTRNPMFLSLVLLHLGVVVAANAGWALLGVPALILYLRFAVISREERFLEGRFGDEYTRYKARVPRWIPRPQTHP